MKLLFCGHGTDPVCAYLQRAWRACQDEIHFLDLDLVDRCGQFDCHSLGKQEIASIETLDWRLNLSDISAIFLRFLGANQPIRSGVRAAADRGSLECAYRFWMELLEGLESPIVNRLSASSSNHSKPYQLLQMKAAGFLVPDTLVTNDIGLAESFCARPAGPVVFKSVSGVRARTQVLDRENYERLRLLADCPTQFQPLIPGFDVRVHVIGNQCFGLRIESNEVDYRFARKDSVSIEPCELPTGIQDRCCRITHNLGLYLSGIDFRVTDEGHWYGLEVNPAPAFTDYEMQAGQPLAKMVLDLLHELGSSGGSLRYIIGEY